MEESHGQGLVYPGTVDSERDLWNGGHTDCVDVGLAPKIAEEPFGAVVRSSSRLHLASADTGGGWDAEEDAGELQLGHHLHQAGAEM